MATTPNLDKILAARHQNTDAAAQTAEEFIERALRAEALASNLLDALKRCVSKDGRYILLDDVEDARAVIAQAEAAQLPGRALDTTESRILAAGLAGLLDLVRLVAAGNTDPDVLEHLALDLLARMEGSR